MSGCTTEGTAVANQTEKEMHRRILAEVKKIKDLHRKKKAKN